jgi:hypothetical protein
VFSSINGVGPCSAQTGPTHFAVGKFDLWKTRLEFGNRALPVLASVGRSVQLSTGADLVAGVRIEEKHIEDALIIRLRPHENTLGSSRKQKEMEDLGCANSIKLNGRARNNLSSSRR